MKERTESRVLALMALALGLFGFSAPYKWHDMSSWITNSALLLALFLAIWAALLCLPSPARGAKRSMAAMLIAGGICALIAGIVFWLDPTSDNDYLFYAVDIADPKDIAANLPVYIRTPSSGTFEIVDPWWAPWGSEKTIYPEDKTNPYWSIGHEMKVAFRVVRGGAKYGRSIPAGDYIIQYDATFKDINYHFDEHLNIQAHDGILIQKIDVWRLIVPGGKQALVYSGDSSKSPIR